MLKALLGQNANYSEVKLVPLEKSSKAHRMYILCIFSRARHKFSHVCESLLPHFNLFCLHNVALRYQKISYGQVGKVPWESTIFFPLTIHPVTILLCPCDRTLCARFKKLSPYHHFLMMLEITFLSYFHHVSLSHHLMKALNVFQCPA